ncbi:MAG TPA: phosphoribosylanthranilate isomerase, partial [Gammaproteobacteria bacterium]|nr:phosphoribosylanthranilate isomerase [Gammaproteobacteria bacterium]
DGLTAARLGVDAIGLVFYPPSTRFVGVDAALRVIRALPPFVSVVGLFLNAEPHEVREVLRRVPLALLQFHGEEEPGYCAAFGRPFIKAVAMQTVDDVAGFGRTFEAAAGLLLDSHAAGDQGGTGMRFDWRLIPRVTGKPIILAGGLNPDNVGEAIREIQPFGVDVSSGVESAKGIKDANLMRAFMRGVERGERRA